MFIFMLYTMLLSSIPVCVLYLSHMGKNIRPFIEACFGYKEKQKSNCDFLEFDFLTSITITINLQLHVYMSQW